MRRYEQIYILRPSLNEEEISTIVENTNKIILEEEGAIISTDRWGMKMLAYPIKKELQGFYVFCDFATTPAAVAEVERKFRIDDSVLKYLTVKLSDAITQEEISAAQDEAVAKASQLEAEMAAETSEEVAKEATVEKVAVKETAAAETSKEVAKEATVEKAAVKETAAAETSKEVAKEATVEKTAGEETESKQTEEKTE